MRIKILLGFILIAAFILGGCGQAPNGQQVADELNKLLTQAALDKVDTAAPPPEVLTATDTPAPPAADATATSTPDAMLSITSIEETGPGRAIVNWDAKGNFPAGFSLVWTREERKPVYPQDENTYTGDPNARSALLSGLPGFVYIVRVCRTSATGCDIYSNAAFFTFTRYAPTPTTNWSQTAIAKTAFANAGSGGGGGGGGSKSTPASKFAILSMGGGEALKALMKWSSDTSPADGFRLYYSTSSKEPKQGSDPYFVIEDGKARQAYVDGKAGTTYNYRMCKMDDGECTVYTPVYKFTFPGKAAPTSGAATPKPEPTNPTATLLIAKIEDAGLGKAIVTWAAEGKFPEGFRILYSSTHNPPTLKDTVVSVTDIALRSAEVSGDPGVKYYFRVCKFVDGACTVFSPVKEFKFAAPPTDLFTLNGVAGAVAGTVDLTWDALSPAPDGFYVLWAAAPKDPVYPDNLKDEISGTATSYTATGLTTGKTYNFRLCTKVGGICTGYSKPIAVTAP